jgi:hypothetical protein
METKYIKDPATFLVDSGLLFEINRRILHPLGLAIAVEVPGEDAPEGGVLVSPMSVLDVRDDPEGFCFEDEAYVQGKAKLAAFLEDTQFRKRIMARRASLGYVIQSIPPEPEQPFMVGR